MSVPMILCRNETFYWLSNFKGRIVTSFQTWNSWNVISLPICFEIAQSFYRMYQEFRHAKLWTLHHQKKLFTIKLPVYILWDVYFINTMQMRMKRMPIQLQHQELILIFLKRKMQFLIFWSQFYERNFVPTSNTFILNSLMVHYVKLIILL